MRVVKTQIMETPHIPFQLLKSANCLNLDHVGSARTPRCLRARERQDGKGCSAHTLWSCCSHTLELQGCGRRGPLPGWHWAAGRAGEPYNTWATLLKFLFLIVINNNICLHRDQLLLVKLPKVQERQLVKLLIAEQDLCQKKGQLPSVRDVTASPPSPGNSPEQQEHHKRN